MTEQEVNRIKTNLVNLLDLQIESVKTRMDLLKTNGAEILGTTNKRTIDKAIKELEVSKYSLMKHLKSQAEAATIDTELKAIHDKLAEVLQIKPPTR